MEEKPNYYAVIPAQVRYDKDLKDKAKLLYGEISSLCNKDGYCYASNTYFANLYGVSNQTIINMINNLVDKGYLTRKIIYEKGTQKILGRYLKIFEGGTQKILMDYKDNNININNKETNNINIISKERFKKPTLEEIEEYCKERNNNVNPKTFYEYFETGGWVDSKGNKVKNWKQKIITWERNAKPTTEKETPNWFNEEQKVTTISEQEQNEMEELLDGLCNIS